MSRKTWNRLAPKFESSVCDVTSSSGAQVAELVRRTKPSQAKTLVDAGCGIGSFVKRFGRRYGRVVAFDFAEAMVRRAKRRCAKVPNVEWTVCGLEAAAGKLGSIGDFVACLNVITSTDPKLRKRQWESLAQLAKPGGYVFFVAPAVESAKRTVKFADEDNNIHRSDFGAGLIYRGDAPQKHYTREELRDIFRDHGLRVISLKRIHYPWSDDGVDDPGLQWPWSWGALGRRRLRGPSTQ